MPNSLLANSLCISIILTRSKVTGGASLFPWCWECNFPNILTPTQYLPEYSILSLKLELRLLLCFFFLNKQCLSNDANALFVSFYSGFPILKVGVNYSTTFPASSLENILAVFFFRPMMLMSTCTDNVSRLLSFYADGSLAVQIKSETVLSSSFYLEKQFEYWNFVEFPRPQLLASDICFNFWSSQFFLAISRLNFVGLCS